MNILILNLAAKQASLLLESGCFCPTLLKKWLSCRPITSCPLQPKRRESVLLRFTKHSQSVVSSLERPHFHCPWHQGMIRKAVPLAPGGIPPNRSGSLWPTRRLSSAKSRGLSWNESCAYRPDSIHPAHKNPTIVRLGKYLIYG